MLAEQSGRGLLASMLRWYLYGHVATVGKRGLDRAEDSRNIHRKNAGSQARRAVKGKLDMDDSW
jgi:hypothetical protein